MDLKTIENTGIVAGYNVYMPAIVPVDYGGTFVYNLSIHLTDGSFIAHSSLELSQRLDDGECIDCTLALIRRDVLASGLFPRCDYLDAGLTKHWRTQSGFPAPERIISACLCGERCRYDGGCHRIDPLARLVLEGKALPVCPEVMGKLPTPRQPCEISQGCVVDAEGVDRTAAFAAGARLILRLAQSFGIQQAVLKERSPSCGSHWIYDGSFSGKRIPGEGIAAKLLREHGIQVTSEEEL